MQLPTTRIAARMPRLAVLAGLVSVAVSAQAQEGDLQRFHPESTPYAGFAAGAGETMAFGDFAVGLHLNYAHNPLVLREGADRIASTISDNLTTHVHATIGLFAPVDLGVSLPFVAWQRGNDPEVALRPWAAGDLRLQPRVQLLRQWKHGLSVLFAPVVTVPLGGASAFAGEPSWSVAPELDLAWRGKRLFVSGFVAFRIRQARVLLDEATLGHELIVRVAAGHRIGESWELIVEGAGGPALAALERGTLGSPLELLAGARYRIKDRMAINLGLGAGILSAPGTPDFRVITGIQYGRGLDPRPQVSCTRHERSGPVKARQTGKDADGDGLDDACDVCSSVGETVNGYEDMDGCPEPDTDGDGLHDPLDQCPNDAGPRPTGCPDRDGDGLLDREDRCPDAAGPRPHGCPDTDKDGFLDPDDKCPLKAEDKDGWEDEDGCPDPDNDLDGILDALDRCPREKETINGIEDADGCPDKGKMLVVVKKEKIEILDRVYFDFDKFTIQKRSFSLLRQVALVIKAHPEIAKIRVEGHTDDVGGKAHNARLSQGRAEAVVDFLVKEGLERERLVGKGFAFDRPLVPNKNAANRAKNRRVEFVILEE